MENKNYKEEKMSMLDHALLYASRGWSVIPLHTPDIVGCSCRNSGCTSVGKHPRYHVDFQNGVKDATKDEEQIEKLWDLWPEANIGVATGTKSDLLVLDIDRDKGGEESLEKMIDEYGPLPDTPEVRSGGGGRHFYFKHPCEEVGNMVGISKGIDVRSSDGYIVAPPSQHESGNEYEWIVSPDDVELAPMPLWLFDLLRSVGQTSCMLQPAGHSPVESILEGTRNTALASLAGTLLCRGFDREMIESMLLSINDTTCIPSLPNGEVRRIAASISRYPRRGFNFSDLGNAKRFVSRHGHRIKYCSEWKKWLVWDGKRWNIDKTGRIMMAAKETAEAIRGEVSESGNDKQRQDGAKHAQNSEQVSRIRAMISLAESEPGVITVPEDFDKDPWLLNCQNGVVDLRTGELAEHDPGLLMTKIAPVDFNPKAECPMWDRFLRQVMNGNDELVSFLQRAIGYSLTGFTAEQCLFILHGIGANGKSTFLDVISKMLGDYAHQADPSTLLAKKGNGVNNDIARLRGARFVGTVEVESGKRLNEALIKQLTGGDTIVARFLFKEYFEFKPEFKIFLAANHKPEIRGTDEAIWRRVNLIPFQVTIPERDRNKGLPAKLAEELPGILAWAVRGCMEWQEKGLEPPEEVRTATRQYREEMDALMGFLNEMCLEDPDGTVLCQNLSGVYRDWCMRNGEEPLNPREFNQLMTYKGFRRGRVTSGENRGRYQWFGVRLVTHELEVDEELQKLL